jgi:hypothetical protein
LDIELQVSKLWALDLHWQPLKLSSPWRWTQSYTTDFPGSEAFGVWMSYTTGFPRSPAWRQNMVNFYAPIWANSLNKFLSISIYLVTLCIHRFCFSGLKIFLKIVSGLNMYRLLFFLSLFP